MLNHIVMFKLRQPGAENIRQAKECLLGMEGRIPQLRYLEVGTDVLHSERSYDLVLITRFDSLEDMQAYQMHPVHVEVSQYISSVRSASVSVDYES